LTSIWAVWHKVNPHRWSPATDRIIVMYDNQADADNFVAIHPQYHYQSGQMDPPTILEVREIKLGELQGYWNPSFP
jgi:hypothetical protein